MNKHLFIVLLIGVTVADEVHSEGVFDENVKQVFLRLSKRLFTYFDDCEDALNKGFTWSGVYFIKPKASFKPFQVWCDMESDGGGWTLIQARYDGLVDFARNWKAYRNGFGTVGSEHWLGNNFIHQITENKDYQLKVEMTGFEENQFAIAKYSPFQVGSEDEKYKLFIGKFSREGQIIDSLSYHNGSMFTTTDNQNDQYSGVAGNCANKFKGGWWYRNCYMSNLNGIWMTKDQSIATRGLQTLENEFGVVFRRAFNIDFYGLKSVEMKVRKLRPT